MATRLEQERACYEAHEPEWTVVHRGTFVVVKGDRLLGAYASIEEALAAGAATFGSQSFLIRKVGEVRTEVNIPALTRGLLRAHPEHTARRSAP